METILIERRAGRRNALRTLGVNPDVTRGLVGQVQLTGREADLLALPFYVGQSGMQELQQAGTGTVFFMAGISAVSGSDPVGG